MCGRRTTTSMHTQVLLSAAHPKKVYRFRRGSVRHNQLVTESKGQLLVRSAHDFSIFHHKIDLAQYFNIVQRVCRSGDNVGS